MFDDQFDLIGGKFVFERGHSVVRKAVNDILCQLFIAFRCHFCRRNIIGIDRFSIDRHLSAFAAVFVTRHAVG